MSGNAPYDLEERTRKFAQDVRNLVRRLPSSISNTEDGKQLIRSSGSVGANYIEAAEGLGEKDFTMHIRISRKEAKESKHWLLLLFVAQNKEVDQERNRLSQEALELTRIFSKIVNDREQKKS
ncbi:MAG: four helix bundle protein [Candidatus Uhrbacteria bacterium]